MNRAISTPLQGFALSMLMLAVVACSPSPPPQPPPPPAPTATPAMPQIVVNEAAPQGKLQNIDKLKLTAASGLTIKDEKRFGAQLASDPKYLKMFGAAHQDLMQQTVVADGVEGSVTFAYFAARAQAVLAFNTVKAFKSDRPLQALIFGNTVVMIQVSTPDDTKLTPFVGKIRDAIVVNANS